MESSSSPQSCRFRDLFITFGLQGCVCVPGSAQRRGAVRLNPLWIQETKPRNHGWSGVEGSLGAPLGSGRPGASEEPGTDPGWCRQTPSGGSTTSAGLLCRLRSRMKREAALFLKWSRAVAAAGSAPRRCSHAELLLARHHFILNTSWGISFDRLAQIILLSFTVKSFNP